MPGTAYTKSSLVVIDDIEADCSGSHPTYYVHDNTLGAPKGSIMCYPITDTERNFTPFILSVYVNEPGVFKESDKEHLEQILQPFALRILLEERLRHLKDDCARRNGNDEH